jgi:hypothetical protein
MPRLIPSTDRKDIPMYSARQATEKFRTLLLASISAASTSALDGWSAANVSFGDEV